MRLGGEVPTSAVAPRRVAQAGPAGGPYAGRSERSERSERSDAGRARTGGNACGRAVPQDKTGRARGGAGGRGAG